VAVKVVPIPQIGPAIGLATDLVQPDAIDIMREDEPLILAIRPLASPTL
jgi:hypothetical protein